LKSVWAKLSRPSLLARLSPAGGSLFMFLRQRFIRARMLLLRQACNEPCDCFAGSLLPHILWQLSYFFVVFAAAVAAAALKTFCCILLSPSSCRCRSRRRFSGPEAGRSVSARAKTEKRQNCSGQKPIYSIPRQL